MEIGCRRCGAKVEFLNTARAENERRQRTEEATRGSENENKKDGPAKGVATSRPPPRWGSVGGVLGRVFVSHQIFWLEIGGRRC